MPGSSTTRRKRRIRSPHPGVVLIPPAPGDRRTSWRARFKDPDSGRFTRVRLDLHEYPSAEARREWAIRKSRALIGRRLDLDAGAPRFTGTPLSEAIERFFAEKQAELRPASVGLYRTVGNKLLAWASDKGLHKADDLTRAKLVDFRVKLISEKKRLHLEGSKRNELVETDEPRSPHTINSDLRKAGTILTRLVELDLLPRLRREDLKIALKKVQAPTERIEYLKPAELQRLLRAALRHDAETYKFTRDEERAQRLEAYRRGITRRELAALQMAGATPRYQAIAPFIVALLITGMRLSEALKLKWSQVDLDALDHEGQRVGEIHLEGTSTKTHKARTIGLEVSPALRSLLASMRLASQGGGLVFALTQGVADAAIARLQETYGAPEFSAQALRRTCGTYLTNSPGIFGAASAYRSAKQLGHAVQVAEKHYLNVARGIPREAHTLEDAMQIKSVVAEVISRVSAADRETSLPSIAV